MGGGTSSPRATALGVQLGKLLIAHGMTSAELAERIGVQRPTVSRWRSGTRMPDLSTVIMICDALDASTAERDALLEMARGGESGPWLAVTMPDQQRQLDTLIALESKASKITNVALGLVPGLLQTSAYARAIMVAGGVPVGQIETRVAVRVGRREALARHEPAHLLALLCESVLHHRIGDDLVMAAQLRHLIAMAELSNVDIRVVPSRSGWHPGLVGSFVLCESGDGASAVHLETQTSGLFLHEPDDVASYGRVVERILAVALSAEDSIEAIAGELATAEAAIA